MAKKLTPQSIALCGMMAAIIFVATYFLKIPMFYGYIHLGDGFILLAAAVLGWPAVVSAALGSMLADLLAGYSIYMVPTFIIKGAVAAVAVLASMKKSRAVINEEGRTMVVDEMKSQPVQMIYMLLAETVMVAGYFITEWLILGFGLAAASAAIMGNVLQGLSGVAVWMLLMPVVKRVQKQQ